MLHHTGRVHRIVLWSVETQGIKQSFIPFFILVNFNSDNKNLAEYPNEWNIRISLTFQTQLHMLTQQQINDAKTRRVYISVLPTPGTELHLVDKGVSYIKLSNGNEFGYVTIVFEYGNQVRFELSLTSLFKAVAADGPRDRDGLTRVQTLEPNGTFNEGVRQIIRENNGSEADQIADLVLAKYKDKPLTIREVQDYVIGGAPKHLIHINIKA